MMSCRSVDDGARGRLENGTRKARCWRVNRKKGRDMNQRPETQKLSKSDLSKTLRP